MDNIHVGLCIEINRKTYVVVAVYPLEKKIAVAKLGRDGNAIVDDSHVAVRILNM